MYALLFNGKAYDLRLFMFAPQALIEDTLQHWHSQRR